MAKYAAATHAEVSAIAKTDLPHESFISGKLASATQARAVDPDEATAAG
jgi:hypothetical protein